MEPPPLPPRSNVPPQPVLPLGYQTSALPGEGWRVFRQFAGGFLIGSAVSAVAWGAGWDALNSNAGGVALVAIPTLKLAVAIVFLCLPGRRGWGGGLLISIAMGFLIFFVSCAVHLSK